jgi:UDP-N-acetylglucosamine 2-epimerase
MKKIYIAIGTRPEIIKMSPLIPCLEKKFNVEIIYTGQHYSDIMSVKIFDDLNIRKPKFYFDSKHKSSAMQFPLMISKIVEVLEKEEPHALIVHGDTNTTLAGALAASKLFIPVIHVESGARSGNKNEPEELNRMLVDQLSLINFPFNTESLNCLKKENIKKNVYNLPNSAREAVKRNIKIARKVSQVVEELSLVKNKYILTTLHRATNTNNVKNLKKYIHTLKEISKTYEVIVSLHPRTKKILAENKLILPQRVRIIEPVGYLDFLMLLDNSRAVLSDSGGIVDESLVLDIPLFIFRNETERNDVIKMRKAYLLKPSYKNTEISEYVSKKFTETFLTKIVKTKPKFQIESAKEMTRIIGKIIK